MRRCVRGHLKTLPLHRQLRSAPVPPLLPPQTNPYVNFVSTKQKAQPHPVAVLVRNWRKETRVGHPENRLATNVVTAPEGQVLSTEINRDGLYRVGAPLHRWGTTDAVEKNKTSHPDRQSNASYALNTRAHLCVCLDTQLIYMKVRVYKSLYIYIWKLDLRTEVSKNPLLPEWLWYLGSCSLKLQKKSRNFKEDKKPLTLERWNGGYASCCLWFYSN